MPEPCRGCAFNEDDWGSCRCQAFALAGDPSATDPAFQRYPFHARTVGAAVKEAALPPPPFIYRRIAKVPQA